MYPINFIQLIGKPVTGGNELSPDIDTDDNDKLPCYIQLIYVSSCPIHC